MPAVSMPFLGGTLILDSAGIPAVIDKLQANIDAMKTAMGQIVLRADINHDGKVDAIDLNEIAAEWQSGVKP